MILNRAGPGTYSDTSGDVYTQAGPHGIVNTRTGEFMADLSAVRSAFDELQELGFIEMTEDASFHVKVAEKSRARCWRLTWLAPVAKVRQWPSWSASRNRAPKHTNAWNSDCAP